MTRSAWAVAIVTSLALGATARADIIEQILVRVNGDILTKSDLEQRQVMALRQRDPNFRPSSDAELQKALVEVTPSVIVDAVDELLLVQRGRELGYSLGNEQFQSILENIKKENKLETDEQFQAALKQEGMTLDDLRKQLERNLLVSRVQQVEVMSKISVSEDEVKKFYDENKGSFSTPPQITLREILIAVPETDKGINVAADDEAKAKAEAVRKRALAGEAFDKLASDLSDSGSKANGGLIGPISRDDLSPDFLKQIQEMKPGEVSPVLRTQRGYQLIKLESSVGAKQKTLDEARAEISDKIAGNKKQGQLEQYLEHLRAQATIDWKNAEIKKAFEVGLQQRKTAEP
ncbi:MAG TPA: peptidyl-prolyl cis-trans isomerase [Vicinamibacterales bacterium]|nr:peptidyl-prolyl cis-trans isomerase [Vicinamibacterales bacterium]